MGWAKCVHSALQHGGTEGGTAALRPADGTGGTSCPRSGGSSPAGEKTEENRNHSKYIIRNINITAFIQFP